MGGELGIKAGEHWAYREKKRWPLFQAYVIDPGTHYDAQIRILVKDGPSTDEIHHVRRVKLPCKWEYVGAYLEHHPEIPRELRDLPVKRDEEDRAPLTPELEVLRVQETMLRKVVREELKSSLRSVGTAVPKLSYTFPEASEATGYSEWTLRREVRLNNLVASYANAKGVIRADELDRWLRSLPEDPH